MRSLLRSLTSFLLVTVIAVPLFCSGCEARVGVYDPYYHDCHGWAAEDPYYTSGNTIHIATIGIRQAQRCR